VPQHEYVWDKDTGRRTCHHVVRYEHLSEDLTKLMAGLFPNGRSAWHRLDAQVKASNNPLRSVVGVTKFTTNVGVGKFHSEQEG
jgi:hypothetical protein